MNRGPDHLAGAYDIFIIGGGVNGCGIARDAAGRGFSTGLAEMNDLASGTSSWSTKLIHGGLRYLEHYEFRLVREALKEREVLLAMAPHIIQPLRFVLPYHKGLRPAWMLRLGLCIYDHLGGRQSLPGTRALDLSGPFGAPLQTRYRRGFAYSDARVDDARLVVLNARDAAARGADIRTHTRVVACRPVDGNWHIDLEANGNRETVQARFLINAAGPWTDRVVNTRGVHDARNVRLVQGSHIVVHRLFAHDHAYIFQNADGRIIFAIPYERDFTLIGTTDRDYDGDPGRARISDAEISYLLDAASEYFRRPLTRHEVVWSYSGVRPLFNDHAGKAQEATRDYVLRMGREESAPVLDIFGGKLTTFRRLAEEAVHHAEKALGARKPGWTAGTPLPGGDFDRHDEAALLRDLHALAPAMDTNTVYRLLRSYGTEARAIVAASPGEAFGHGLHEAELDFMRRNEWAVTTEDVLWRRSKLGLRFSDTQVAKLAAYMAR